MKRIILAAFAVFVLIVAPASANKIKPSLSVSPAAPVAPQQLTFSGCGYVPNELVTLVIYTPTYAGWTGRVADAGGCFSGLDNFEAPVPGGYTARTYQSNDHHADAVLKFAVG